MSKLGNHNLEIQKAVEMGENNKKVIAATQAWCSHLVIEDTSAGLIHEMYNLPMNQNIRCPHATDGFGGMNFEWIASDFIIQNCRGCKFHKETSDKNFGRDVLAKYDLQIANLKAIENLKTAQKQKLHTEIQRAGKKNYLSTSISHRSVLEIIYTLGDNDVNHDEIADKIVEASRIAPSIFNSTAIDFLSLYFEDDLGDKLTQAVKNVVSKGSSSSVSEFAIERIKESIRNSKHIDDATHLLSQIINDDQLRDEFDLVHKIIAGLQYVKPLVNAEAQITYPHSIDFILRAYQLSPSNILDCIKKQLLLDDKVQRININGLLQEILPKDSGMGLPLLENLMNSLEFEDDIYWDSADYNTCLTIVILFKSNGQAVKESIVSKLKTLSLGAKLEVFHLIGMIVTDRWIVTNSLEYCKELVGQLFVCLFEKGSKKETDEKILSTFSQILRESGLLLHEHFDSLIGYFVDLYKQYKTFKWYLAELDKPNVTGTTFNPYRGMSFLDVHSVEMDLSRKMREVEELLQTIIREDENTSSDSILNMVLNLDSDADGLLKSKLVGLLRKSLTDTLKIGEVLPHLYGFLLDHKSINVRDEALKFLNHLIENHSQIVTQSFIDLVKIFIGDNNNIVKARAVECLGSLAKVFPEFIEQEQIKDYVKLLINDYKVVHRSATAQVYAIHPLLNAEQKQMVLTSLLVLEKHYREENNDTEFCKELIKLLLFITSENKRQYDFVVSERLLKYTKSKEYYTILDTLKRFTEIRRDHPHFSRTWLVEILGFLQITKPEPNSWNDSRTNFIEEIYDLEVNLIKLELNLIDTFVRDRIQKEYFYDVFQIFNILSYFNLHSSVIELSKHLKSEVANVKANERILEINDRYLRACTLEVQVKGKMLNNQIINGLQ